MIRIMIQPVMRYRQTDAYDFDDDTPATIKIPSRSLGEGLDILGIRLDKSSLNTRSSREKPIWWGVDDVICPWSYGGSIFGSRMGIPLTKTYSGKIKVPCSSREKNGRASMLTYDISSRRIG